MRDVLGGTTRTTSDRVTASITTDDSAVDGTWSAEYLCMADLGVPSYVPMIIKPAGGAVVTVQVKAPDAEAWEDVGDTAGAVNGTTVNPVSTAMLFGGWRLRAGVKTGSLNGGSATVRLGVA